MTLDKAIEIVTVENTCSPTRHTPDLNDAQWLLIQAGKRLKSQRNSTAKGAKRLLPGETEK